MASDEHRTDTYYITTSIPYVNAAPHIGHALEYVQTDAFARYHRLLGDDTRFLTGTDENSLKNVQAAEREGMPTAELVQKYAQVFLTRARQLDISNDDFIRTAVERRHSLGAQTLWEAVDRQGDIYKRSYQGLYCVGCEQFYTEDELVDGRCPEHGTRPDVVEEENYFFRLSRYGDHLLQLLDRGELRIVPESRRNEVRSFIARGLQDFSISRSRERARGWGIEVPGDPDQVMYVWFDALTNYISALGYGADGPLYRRYWLENSQRVHVIGKGIVRFHAVYWPAMLLAAGLPLPTTIFVHGYLTVDGVKMSKSLGNVVDPGTLVERFGADAVRYWFLREVPPTGDADYTDDKLLRRYTADLANDLGNLLNRTVSMLHRYRNGLVPATTTPSEDLMATAGTLPERLHVAMTHDYDPQAALAAIWELVTRTNRYVEESAPWALSKAERAGDGAAARRLDTVLLSLAEALRLVAEALRPFLPSTAERMAAQLGVTLVKGDWTAALSWGSLAAGAKAGEPRPIFPKREVEQPATSH